ncbi:MAG TPA: LysM domain-containing protein [Solirubrobacteraceae bacterium]|nr:LysM domain-containing protein [Solirubrobacteraceae bacterium]
MTSRSSRRWLAPTALAVVAVALFQTVTSGDKADGSARPDASVATATTKPAASPKTYRVKPGDVLSSIAETTGVSLATIERLNPDVDAKALHAGQQIQLTP